MDYSVERHYIGTSNKHSGGSGTIQSMSRLGLEQYTHNDFIVSTLVPVEPSSQQPSRNFEVYKLELNIRGDLFNASANQTTKLMLGKYTVRVGIFDRLNPTCTQRLDLFYLYVGNDFIDEKELIALLKSIRNRNNSAATTFDNVNSMRKMQQFEEGDRGVVKLASDYLFFGGSGGGSKSSKKFDHHAYLNSDFILFFILILIVVIVAILLSCLTIVCLYGRFKKQYRMSTKKSKSASESTDGCYTLIFSSLLNPRFIENPKFFKGMINGRKKKFEGGGDEDDFDNEESHFTTGSRVKTLSTKKKYLNTSTSSSETNSDELDKPQYTR